MRPPIPGIDLPGEAPGRIADRLWKKAYYESQKDYYCDLSSKPQTKGTSDFVYKFAYEFCLEGNLYRAGDAVNFSIGQGDTIVTPLQLARAYGALSNGGILWEPTVAKAIVSPEGEVLRRIAPSARILLCGSLSTDDGDDGYRLRNYPRLMSRRASMVGFNTIDHWGLYPEATAKIAAWTASGALVTQTEVVDGLEAAPELLVRLFSGDHLGKLVAKVADA